MFGKRKTAMLVAEFLGTFTLASAILSMSGRTTFPFFSAAAAGLTLGLMVLVIGTTSGAHLNPAVTIGLWSLRKVQTMQALVYVAAQMLGGLVAWRVNEYLLDQALPNLAAAGWDWRIAVAEIIGTLIFTFGIAAAVYHGYEGMRLASTIGTALFVGVIVASFASTGVLNPAVAVGVRSWNVSYVVGPIVGAVLGMNLYSWLFAVNPVVAKKTVARKKK